ncbi:lipoprotein insertase outer membrane protein LolB [Candidatus Fukatsuia symbiotica]|uniref:Outer-membrane lipoprotein LolB n=1 Tax=Candidatus Fukatsuia symbiotica TaxID=1878942 RepID=A0A2U8I5I9_9GAMM|nr:lipoprotein insertase outer membrane protein LolB [Candidatus Fukatsuia symbiotica]AWK14390.1 lipoprotein localization factor LolB [Candidatus Fukatsuia symbiotica]MEA9444659.1 lipoprotein insertase outer membrane protein LolB [Candidatus Fukatsuia symbiotica]
MHKYRTLPLISLILTACTTLQPVSTTTDPNSSQWRQHEQQLQQVDQFQISGALAYFSDQQKVYTRFFWQQYSKERYRLVLTSPLGTTEFELRVEPTVTLLIDNQGKRYFSENPQEMMQKLTGMSLPLDNLRQWIVGLPGDSHDFTLDNQYRLKQINYQQDDQTWLVSYQNYNTGPTLQLPSRIELRQVKSGEGERRIKLKMDNWTLK